MKIGDVFPSNYLKASDLNGSVVPVTIDHVAVEAVGRDEEKRPVLYFVGKSKGVVLNRTNAKKIAEIVGTEEMDDWSGARIALFSAMVEYQGKSVESIRIKAVPAVRKPEPMPEPVDIDEDAIPF
jgi:hypothetical protein